MVMNNIIFFFFFFFGVCNYSKAIACMQLHSNDVISADVNENCYKNFRMSYCCFGQPVSSLHTPEHNRCKVQFVDVSRTWKSYAKHKQLRGFFESALRTLPCM